MTDQTAINKSIIEQIVEATVETQKTFFDSLHQNVIRASRQKETGINIEAFPILFRGSSSEEVVRAYNYLDSLLSTGSENLKLRYQGLRIGQIAIPGTKWIKKFKKTEDVSLPDFQKSYVANSIGIGQVKDSIVGTYPSGLNALNKIHEMILSENERGRTILMNDQARISQQAAISPNPVDYGKLREYDPEVHAWVLDTSIAVFTELFGEMINSVPKPKSGTLRAGGLDQKFLDWIVKRNLQIGEPGSRIEKWIDETEDKLVGVVEKRYRDVEGSKGGMIRAQYHELVAHVRDIAQLALFEHGPYLWHEAMDLEAVRRLIFQAQENVDASGTHAHAAYSSVKRARERLIDVQVQMQTVAKAAYRFFKYFSPEEATKITGELPAKTAAIQEIEGVGKFPVQLVKVGKTSLPQVIPGYVNVGNQHINLAVLGDKMQGLWSLLSSKDVSKVALPSDALERMGKIQHTIVTMDPILVDRFYTEIDETKNNLKATVGDLGTAALLYRIADLKLRTMIANTDLMSGAVRKAYSGHAIDYAVNLETASDPSETADVVSKIVTPYEKLISTLPADVRKNADKFISKVRETTQKVIAHTARAEAAIDNYACAMYGGLPKETMKQIKRLLPLGE